MIGLNHMKPKREKLSQRERLNTLKVTLSNGISKFGDILFDYVNSVFLSGITNGGFWLSLYQSSEVIISVIFNFIGGSFSDLNDRKKIIWYCDLFSGITCIFLAIFIPKTFFIYSILIINIILAVITSYRSPAYKAVFREIVLSKNINRVNSILEVVKQTVTLLSPTISLIISNFIGNRNALILDGVSFIISGFLIYKLDILIEPKLKKKRKSTLSQIKEGIKYIYQNSIIFLIISFSSIVNFVIAGYNLILPFSTYAFSNSNIKTYAVFLTAESIGGLIGASLSTFIKKEPTIKFLIFCIFLAGLSLTPVGLLYQLTNSIFISAIGIALFNFFLSIFNIQFMSFVQVKTDINYIGRVFGTIFSVAILFMPVGTFFFKCFFYLKSANNYFILGILLTIISIFTLGLNYILNKKA